MHACRCTMCDWIVMLSFEHSMHVHVVHSLAQPWLTMTSTHPRSRTYRQVDLALVHHPCGPGARAPSKDPDGVASNNALWMGMQRALKDGLTRSIGVSNFKSADLKSLDTSKAVPAVNQCAMSVTKRISLSRVVTRLSCMSVRWTIRICRVTEACGFVVAILR